MTEAAIQWWSHFGYGTPDERCTDALKAWLKRRYRPKPKTFVESVFLAVMLQVIINVVAAMITEWLLSDREAAEQPDHCSRGKMMTWKSEQLSRNVIQLKVKGSRRTEWEQWFLLSGDRHWDNPKSDHALQKDHLDEAVKPQRRRD